MESITRSNASAVKIRRFVLLCVTSAAATLSIAPPVTAASLEAGGLADMSIEKLANVRITSVSKHRQKLSDAAASIYVITADDIRRSGATTIPEILRLAPNLEVAQRDSVEYAISARGFNNAIGNKLLVLIDGRTVYTPLFSGVFWEMQDTMIQDIDRIEVISGPGATLWGANAVNGVINIITKSSSKTQGTLLSTDAGNQERGFAARFGGRFGDNGSYRVYGKGRDWSHTQQASGADARDSFQRGQVGFRADWENAIGAFTLQGDAYSGESEDRGVIQGFQLGKLSISGRNLLGRWKRRLDSGSDVQVQAYYDHTERDDVIAFRPETDIYDIEFQQEIPRGVHDLLWGAGYRQGTDQVDPGIVTLFMPDSRTLHWENVFLQDEVRLSDRLVGTAGLKLEWNDYTDLEYLPSARLAWKVRDNRLLWGSVSRAVRAPSRLDRDVFSPDLRGGGFTVQGGPDFQSEVANVFELGYRAQPAPSASYSITVFYHDWDRLRSGTAAPVHIVNDIAGEVYGVEAWGSYQPARFWVLKAGFLHLTEHLHLKGGAATSIGPDSSSLRNDPKYQWSLDSSFTLPHRTRLDLALRSVSDLTIQPVPGYTELNARLAWNPSDDLELSVTGRNLLHRSHPEFGSATSRSEIDRSILFAVRAML